MPLISIIIPTYNRAEFLPSSVKSVLEQNFEDWELIIIDDGSIDNTRDLVNQYLLDSRVFYFFQENKGVSAARNLGAKKSSGEWLVFLDSDDQLEEGALLAFASSTCNSLNLIVGGMKLISENGIQIRLPKDVKPIAKIPGIFCIRKSIFNSVNGYDPEFRFGENTELFHRIRLIDRDEFFINVVTVKYYLNPIGASKDLRNMTESNLLILIKHQNTLSNNMKHIYHQIIGVNQIRFRNFKEARKHLWLAFLYKPFKIGTLLRFGISLAPFLAKSIYPEKV